MTNHHYIKKEDEKIKIDEVVLQPEGETQIDQDLASCCDGAGKPVKQIGEKISLILVFALLVLSVIQSIELYNLRAQITSGQFSTGAAAPAAGSDQGLPAQQGGC